MSIRGGVVDGLRGLGLRISVTVPQTVTVPAARELPTIHFAHAVAP
jgi:hypothetical protein